MFDPALVQKFFEVILIDLVMSGDNAIVIGLAVASIPLAKRKRVVVFGIIAATVLRILLASVAVPLLKVIGLTLAGGLLLAWVSWEFFRELRADGGEDKTHAVKESPKTPKAAVLQILFADISMSLDNVLAVAGAAREHPQVLVFGLAFSIVLMAVASTWIAKIIGRYKAIGYLGLLVIVWVALEMIWSGWGEVAHHFSLTTPFLP